MKAKKQKQDTYSGLEKTVIVAGLLLITVGCIANLYGAFFNLRFVYDSIDFIYYLRYVILLLGGFAVGYLFVKKETSRHSQLFLGVAYALLAMALYWVFDLIRVSFQNLVGYPPFPWGKMVFMGIPLLAVIGALIIAYFSQYKKSDSLGLSRFTKIVIILSFIGYEVYTLASGIFFFIDGMSTYDPTTPLWLTLGSYLVTPLVIAIVSYFMLGNIKKQIDRLFYAVFIGASYSIFTIVLWEFRTDASHEATTVFSGVVTAFTLLLTGILLWHTRKATK